MYSGEDSSGSRNNNFASWPISQSACAGMATGTSADQVDWAALAQQWIQMKETSNLQNNYTTVKTEVNTAANSEKYEEKGEAPMEVVKDDEPAGQNSLIPPPPPFMNMIVRQDWQAPWFQNQQFSTTSNWNQWSTTNVGSSSMLQLSSSVQQPQSFFNDVANSHVPLKTMMTTELSTQPATETPAIDAAKRKALPAWIREGLEKMEREKQKQLEKNKKFSTNNETESVLGTKYTIEEKRDAIEDILQKTKDEKEYTTDDEQGDNEKEEKPVGVKQTTVNKTASEKFIEKTREELLEDLMFAVRRSLTELLLEVTNEEISSIAQETLRKHRAKASSAQVFRKSAISSITGKLGLGAYANSASENSDSDQSSGGEEDNDSEDEIKENIRARQNAFKAIAQEIELSINEDKNFQRSSPSDQSQHYNNKDKLKGESGTTGSPRKSYDKDSGETQPDKISQTNGKRFKERTTRFSSSKDSKIKANTYLLQQQTGGHSVSVMSSSGSTSTAIGGGANLGNRESNKGNDKKKSTTSSSSRRSYSSDSSSTSRDSYKYAGGSSSNNSSRHHKSSRERSHRKYSRHSRRDNNHDHQSDSDDHHQYSNKHRHHRHRSSRKSSYRSKDSRSRSRSRSRSHSRAKSGTSSSKRSDQRY